MERQDIDALLIGALYGELTPADESRLLAHLESHPTDRGALDDLKSTRQTLVDSRIFAIQLDPPQAVSALLLQEAHRRAPKMVVANDSGNEGSWFARFARNFMAHPAMAAAAMLVLVMGGAGIMWMKNGSQSASKEYSQEAPQKQRAESSPSSNVALEMAPAAAPEGHGAADQGASMAGSGYNADLYDDLSAKGGKAEEAKAVAQAPADGDERKRDEQYAFEQQQRRAANDLSKAQRNAAGIAVTTGTDRQPKDLDLDDAKAKNDDAVASNKVGTKSGASKGAGSAAVAGPGTGGGGGAPAPGRGGDLAFGGESAANGVSGAGPRGGADATGGGYAQAPATTVTAGKTATGTGSVTTTPTPKTTAPPKPTTTTSKAAAAAPSPPPPPADKAGKKPAPAQVTKPAEQPVAPRAEPAKESAPKKEDATTAWAKAEHVRALSLAKNGDCAGAAKVALGVSNRAPSYYAQNMATDRGLKQCMQYINTARDKQAEEREKARASKRINADEPSNVK